MRRLPFILFAVLPGLIGLGVGGYFIVTNVIETPAALTVGAGTDACKVLTAPSAQQLLGPSAQQASQRQGAGYSYCTYTASGDRFISLEVAGRDLISSEAPSSAPSNEGVGAGTRLVNTAAGTHSVIADGSAQGRVAFKGEVGLFVTAGHYGQFFGSDATRELAYEDLLERRLIPQLLPRL